MDLGKKVREIAFGVSMLASSACTPGFITDPEMIEIYERCSTGAYFATLGTYLTDYGPIGPESEGAAREARKECLRENGFSINAPEFYQP